MGLRPTAPQHEVAYKDLCKLLDDHSKGMTPLEMLAIAANMVGKLVAMQDQRRTTPAEALEVVAKNLEYGNQQVLQQFAERPSEGRA